VKFRGNKKVTFFNKKDKITRTVYVEIFIATNDNVGYFHTLFSFLCFHCIVKISSKICKWNIAACTLLLRTLNSIYQVSVTGF